MQAKTARQLMIAMTMVPATLMLLTGCAGNGSAAAGTYYGQTGKGSDPAIITVDGDTVTWGDFGCDNVGEIDMNDSDTSVGTLDKTRTIVAWTQEGRYSNTDPFTESEDGSVVTLSGGTYSKAGTDAGDAILAEQEQECQEYAEQKAENEAAQSEQADADAKLKPAFDKIVAALIAAGEAGDLSGAQGIFADNGMTLDEFAAYMERNYSLSADDFLYSIQYAPDQAKAELDANKR